MIIDVLANGFTVWSDGFRHLGQRWNKPIVFLSMYGPQNAVRAVWATLNLKRGGVVQVAGESVVLDADAEYVTVQRPVGTKSDDLLHLVTMDQRATSRVSAFADKFFAVGAHPEWNWFGRFNRLCQIPVRRSWAPALWQLGQRDESPPIVRLDGVGVPGYEISCDTERWREIVTGNLSALLAWPRRDEHEDTATKDCKSVEALQG